MNNYFVFFIIVIIFFFICSEIVLNIIYFLRWKKWYWENRGPFVFSSRLGYAHRPNFTEIKKKERKNEKDTGKIHYEISKYGFTWLHGITPSSPKIWFIGDSFTEAVHFPKEDVYCGVIWQLLEKRYTVVNSGLGGGRMVHLKSIYMHYQKALNPAIVFVQLSHNNFYDIALGLRNQSDKFSHRLSCRIPRNSIDKLFSYSLIGNKLFSYFRPPRIKYNDDEKAFLLCQNLKEEEWVKNIKNECLEIKQSNPNGKILFFLPPSPFVPDLDDSTKLKVINQIAINNSKTYDIFVEANRILSQQKLFFTENNLELIDFNQSLQAMPVDEMCELFIDRSHLSIKGHKWLADQLLQYIQSFDIA